MLQGPLAVAFMLHKMAFQLSSEVVALHLYSITAKGYLCNQGGTASLLLLSRYACHILNMANKHGVTLITAYIPAHLNVEANHLCQGE